MKKIVLFASGNGTNAQQIVDYFSSNSLVEFPMLFCNKNNAFVLERAKKLNIPTTLINKENFYHNNEILNMLIEINPDLIVLAGFLWLIPEKIIVQFSKKIINIHPALLPAYGGKGMYGHHVHEAVVANKEKQSGITIHYANQHYDEGDIIFQAHCEVNANDSADDVAEKIHNLEKQYFPKVIEKLLFD